MAEQRSTTRAHTAPHPDDPSKPDSPDELTKPSRKYIVKKALAEFLDDQCTDLAAALTYFAVLALPPALIALVSLVGVFGQGEESVNAILQIITNLGQGDVVEFLRGPLTNIVENQQAGLGLVIGLALALFSASGYVNAFSRAMNRVYEIDEGRPIWKLRPQMILITLVAVLMIAVALLILVLSGGVAREIGNLIGLGSTAVTVWNIVKWPVLAGIIVLVVAILYYATPNVKQPKFRWMSMGSFIAIVVWLVASIAFGIYVANFGNYGTYGTLGSVIVFLLWLWITNNALLFGAEVDAEVERGRQLQAGIPAEEAIQLPPRDTRASEKKQKKEQEDIEQARALRLSRGHEDDPDEVPGAETADPSDDHPQPAGVGDRTSGGSTRRSDRS
jgi:membrane protein